MFTFVRESEPHPGFDARWNVDRQRSFLVDAFTAAAGGAGIGDNLACAFALTAGPADTEESLLEPKLSRSFAGWTDLQRGGGFRAGAVTVLASFPPGDFEFGFFAVDGLFER